jgi:transposase
MQQGTTLGIDSAKNVLQLHGVNGRGKIVLQKRLSRNKVLAFIAKLPACLIGMEASGGSHYWAREFTNLGPEVKLMAPQFVKPYIQGNKNDSHEAAAICEAVSRPRRRFVPIKSVAQQDMQALHRLRERPIKMRTALVNQIRGLWSEYGIVMPKGVPQVRHKVPFLLEDADNGLTGEAREWLQSLQAELPFVDEQIEATTERMKQMFAADEACQRLAALRGIGPLTATALVAAVGDARGFKNGRQLAAWLGLVPKQNSTGGKPTLLGISKRGNSSLRKLLIHGARAVVRHLQDKTDAWSCWLKGVEERRGKNRACVAHANKVARVAWGLLAREERYRPALAQTGETCRNPSCNNTMASGVKDWLRL